MKYKRKKDKNFWLLARSYLHDYMPVTRNLSDKSVEAYKEALKTFLRFLKEEKGITEEKVIFDVFCSDNIKGFVGWLKENGYAAKIVNLKLTAIRSFLKYCSEEDFELRGVYTVGMQHKETEGREKAD